MSSSPDCLRYQLETEKRTSSTVSKTVSWVAEGDHRLKVSMLHRGLNATQVQFKPIIFLFAPLIAGFRCLLKKFGNRAESMVRENRNYSERHK